MISQILEQLDSLETHPRDKLDLMNQAIELIQKATNRELVEIEEIRDERIEAWRNA